MLNANLATIYKPTEKLTIDEQLYPYRGRTKFTQYMPSKPAKYGIKVWWVCDAENGFPLKGIIYTGKIGNTRDVNQGERVVKELAIAYKGSGRNISMDRFFTTLPLAKFLLTWNLTVVGTLKKNKPYIPQEMKASKTRGLLSTVFGFHEKVTMCSYVPKKNKAVILLSTMHDDDTISDAIHQKPEMILFYNKTKAGVDTMDQMCSRYTSQRRTCRWPLAFFFNILDIGSLAAYLIYYENNKMIPKKTTQRKTFLLQLADELAMPIIEDRSANQQIMRHESSKIAINSFFARPITAVQVPADNNPRDTTGRKVVVGSCYICSNQPIRKQRKTRKSCSQCQKPVCDEHTAKVTKCLECHQ